MNPFHWFLIFVAVVWGSILWFARGIISTLSRHAAEHAKVYAGAYAKGSALIAVAVLTSFGETFKALSPDVAAVLPWWSWLALFFQPVISGLAVYVAYVDGSMKKIRDEKQAAENKDKKGTE